MLALTSNFARQLFEVSVLAAFSRPFSHLLHVKVSGLACLPRLFILFCVRARLAWILRSGRPESCLIMHKLKVTRPGD